VAATILLGLFGLGFGTLVKNQVAGILLTIGGTFILEPLLVALARAIFHYDLNWLPTAAAQALAGSLSRGFGSGHDPITHLFAWWQGGLIMLAWGLIPSPFGYFTTVRATSPSRDAQPRNTVPGRAARPSSLAAPSTRMGTPLTRVWVTPTGASAVRRSPLAGKSRIRRRGPGAIVSGSKTQRSAAWPTATVPRSASP
jgi:hypothetical protein